MVKEDSDLGHQEDGSGDQVLAAKSGRVGPATQSHDVCVCVWGGKTHMMETAYNTSVGRWSLGHLASQSRQLSSRPVRDCLKSNQLSNQDNKRQTKVAGS